MKKSSFSAITWFVLLSSLGIVWRGLSVAIPEMEKEFARGPKWLRVICYIPYIGVMFTVITLIVLAAVCYFLIELPCAIRRFRRGPTPRFIQAKQRRLRSRMRACLDIDRQLGTRPMIRDVGFDPIGGFLYTDWMSVGSGDEVHQYDWRIPGIPGSALTKSPPRIVEVPKEQMANTGWVVRQLREMFTGDQEYYDFVFENRLKSRLTDCPELAEAIDTCQWIDAIEAAS